VLLAGGTIQEIQPTGQFFASPQTRAGREFVATGTCSDPSPDARVEELEPCAVVGLRPPATGKPVASASIGPRGFVWLLEGKLAGTAQPGVVADIRTDLQSLRRVGVTDLISLTETPLDSSSLRTYGITAHWFPIPDSRAPTIPQAREICSKIDALLHADAVIAVHCRAGLGRTGTILVAYLIWCGRTAIDALETARRFEPKWVQSEHQVKFLESFAADRPVPMQSTQLPTPPRVPTTALPESPTGVTPTTR
jgi:atypical dual specificity phosphatase